ncbi:MAG TPA: xanthine dehydrogenase family protein molybdopterin-binding subunit [Anaeromyxobacter sp.]|nr:xanthine dehydrogenase family protein molybdopterin-binding subunit [Anaeromyxobacter sp.]
MAEEQDGTSTRARFPVGIAGEDLRFEERDLPAGEPPPWPPNDGLAVVGKPTPRIEAKQIVTGRARYTADVQLRGMLYARRIVSTIPHGRVLAIDTSRAEALPGVKAIHLMERTYDGPRLRDPAAEPPSRWPTVRYVGQPLGAIAATTPEAAEEAVRLVEVRYEPLPFVLEPDAALADGAPLVYPGEVETVAAGTAAPVPMRGNQRGPTRVARGDLERGFAEAELVVEGTFATQVQTHCSLETHGVVASWDDGQLEIHASTQAVTGFRRDMAQLLGIPPERIRVRAEYVGGGFGSKLATGGYAVLAAELSRKAERPVRLMLDRAEEQVSTGNRPGARQRLRIGARRDGTLTAVQLESFGSAGVGTGAGVGRAAGWMYACPNFLSEQSDVFVNAGPGSPFRAPGEPLGVFALEQLIDELAERLSLDPLELRDRIDTRDDAAGAQHRVERRIGAEKAGWARRHAPGADPGPVKRGLGVAQALWPRIVIMPAACEVAVSRSGRVELRSAAQDIGTGTRTVLAQVVAEELGLSAHQVVVRIGDSDLPPAPLSGGSNLTGSLTPAARTAARQVGERLLSVAAKALRVDPAELALEHGGIVTRKDSRAVMAFAEAASRLGSGGLLVRGERKEDYGFSGQGLRGAIGGVQFAEVAVDMETGVVKVERVVAVQDCGRPVNPLGLENQLNGGILQGISWALYEDRVLDAGTGRMLNDDLEAYRLVGPREVPRIEVHFIEEYRARSSTDAGGIAEPANIATAAAVANAVYNATGVRVRELPMTPRRVLAALADARPRSE